MGISQPVCSFHERQTKRSNSHERLHIEKFLVMEQCCVNNPRRYSSDEPWPTEQPPLAVFPDCTRRYWVDMWSAHRIPQLHFQLSKPEYWVIPIINVYMKLWYYGRNRILVDCNLYAHALRLSPRSPPSFFPVHILYSRYKDKWCYCMRNCPLLTMNYIAFELARKTYLNTLLSITPSAAYVTHSYYVVCGCNSWCINETWTSTASLTMSSTVLLDALPQLIVKRFLEKSKFKIDPIQRVTQSPYLTLHVTVRELSGVFSQPHKP
jgi:hypothetical protein